MIQVLNVCQDVPIWAGNLKITARPWRRHITAPVFRTMPGRTQAQDLKGDLAVVWEL